MSGSLARRYARAVMGIGIDNDNFETLNRQIGDLAEAMSISPQLADTLTSPVFARADRKRVLVAILDRLNADTVVKNFTFLLLDRERLAALPGIARELQRMIDERVGRISAEVLSATTLSNAQLDQLKAMLETLSGKQVQLSSAEDPDLLGGIVAKIGDIVYDGSLRTQLRQVQGSMVK